MRFTLPIFLALLALPLVAAAQSSTLIIRADADCTLTVNAQAQGQLAADTAKAVKVGGGEQLIECKAANGAKVEQTLSVDSGSQKVVNLKLAAKVTAVASGIDKRYSAPGDGTVVDSKTGLQWTQRDNAIDIKWNSARSYCSNLGTAGGGWRLPSMDELEGIYDRSGTLTTSCPKYTCEVSPLFSLSGYWYWSNQSNGSSKAWFFFLGSGSRYSATVSRANNLRALCVRRRS